MSRFEQVDPKQEQATAGTFSLKFPDEAPNKDVAMTLAFNIPEHLSITDAGLPYGLPQANRSEIKNGNVSQDLSTSTRNVPTHHFDSNALSGSVAYTNRSMDAIKKMLSNPATEPYAQREFGKRLHTMQDFYAHTNYVESKLKANPRLSPQSIPLVSWNEIQSGKTHYRSGFSVPDETTQLLSRSDVVNSLNRSGAKIRGTQYLPSDQYDRITSFSDRLNYSTNSRYSVLHRDLNKDGSYTEQGKVVNPYTGARLYDYARDLAIRETARQWDQFARYGQKAHERHPKS